MAAVVAEQRPQQPRSEQNTPASFLLALAMHALLLGALWISVKWNVEPSGAVVVELWGAAPAAGPAAAPEPVVVAPPPPPAPPKAEPERPNADIVVKQEKKAPPKVEPDPKKIEAEKRRIEAERQRAEDEAKRREAEKKQLEAERRKQAEVAAQAAERKREDERREAVRRAEEARMLAQAGGSPGGSTGGSAAGSAGGRPGGTAAAGGGGDASYAGQLNALIRPRIIFAVPEHTPASIYAEFQVDLLPTGEILAVKKLKASGLPGYDEAVERAIRRTDPFPRKRDGTMERTVIIRFRPVDAQ